MTRDEILEADEAKLRVLAAEVLTPGPWNHRWEAAQLRVPRNADSDYRCRKCRRWGRLDSWCPVPDPIEGSLPDIAERLKPKMIRSVRPGLKELDNLWDGTAGREYVWWFEATAADRIRVLLLALLEEKP